MLHQSNLCTYYDLNQNPGLAQKINVRADKFEFLEEPSIAQKLIRFVDGKQTHVNFYLLKCIAVVVCICSKISTR